jgi:hypothetical protein
MPLIATILANVIVTVEYIAARQADFFVGNLDVRTQANDSRQGQIGIDFFAIVLDLFCFTLHQQDNSAAPGADIERFVGCI